MKTRIVLATCALLFAGGCVASKGGNTPAPCGKCGPAFKVSNPGGEGTLISLADSLAPLQHRFNADKDKARLVALVSPT